MTAVESQVRKGGNSTGIFIPKDATTQDKIKIGDTVKRLIVKHTTVLKNSFGAVNLTRPTSAILKEVDEEAWGE